MKSRNLENLRRLGKLKAESPRRAEFEGLLRAGRIRLKDAKSTALQLESRFDLAYNAAHALSLAALRWHGFRSDNRYLVFQCLEHTLRMPAEKWRVLDQAHKKRNLAEYEGEIDVDPALLEALLRITRELEAAVTALSPISE